MVYYEEMVEDAFLKANYSRTKATMAIDHIITRFFLLVIIVLFLYLIIISIGDINLDVIGLILIVSIGLILLFFESERNGNIQRRSATPIRIKEDEILIYASWFERINGFNGNVHRAEIVSVHVHYGEKPHTMSPILLRKMSDGAGELEFKLINGKSRYSGPKPSKTLNEVTYYLRSHWELDIEPKGTAHIQIG